MHDILKAIIQTKVEEVKQLKKTALADLSIHTLIPKPDQQVFKSSLKQQGLSIIAEVKRQSPSKGHLSTIDDPTTLVQSYIDGGASAISVLTDKQYFGGHQDDLTRIVQYVKDKPIAVLRKDFIIDPIQLIESYLLQCDAVLLIVAVLGNKIKSLFDEAKRLGLDVLVEVHNQEELDIAIDIGADIIGINNRNLNTFAEDLSVSLQLRSLIPDSVVSVSESAIRTVNDIKRIKAAGFHSELIGEGLVKSAKPAELLSALRGYCEA